MAAQVLPLQSPPLSLPQGPYGSSMAGSYGNVGTTPQLHSPYHESSQPSYLMISPPPPHADVPYRKRASHSPQTVLGGSAIRHRAPVVQHHRPEYSRERSHNRDEMLLAYATEHGSLHQSQSLPPVPADGPNIPPMYSVPEYNMSPPTTVYPQQGGYFGAPLSVPAGHTESDLPMQPSGGDMQSYYPSRPPSHAPPMSLPPAEPSPAMYGGGGPHSSQSSLPGLGLSMHSYATGPMTLESTPAEIEIMPSRPKPQCWDHGCNGRQFSTFSNLLRHQREKSGSAMKAVCPHCGTEFTRTTARNGHMSGGKCKGRADAEASNRPKKV